MYCAVGVTSRLPSFIETANQASRRVAIDGCEVHCLKKGFEAAGVSINVHVVVTDLGIEKAITSTIRRMRSPGWRVRRARRSAQGAAAAAAKSPKHERREGYYPRRRVRFRHRGNGGPRGRYRHPACHRHPQ